MKLGAPIRWALAGGLLAIAAMAAESTEQANESHRNSKKIAPANQQVAGGANSARADVAQVQRMARNVRKKFGHLEKRVGQIESMIEQDHQQPHSPTASSSPETQQASGSRHQEQWVPAPAPAQSGSDEDDVQPSEFSPDGPNQADPQTGGSSGDELGAHELVRLSGGANASSAQPIIRSVIPSRLGDDNDQQQAGSDTLGAQDNTDQQQQQQMVGDEARPATQQESLPAPSQQQSGGSMLGPEWVPNGSYDFFTALNAKNHGPAGGLVGRARGATATKTAPLAPSAAKFQNMTVHSDSHTGLSQSQNSSAPQTSTDESAKRQLISDAPPQQRHQELQEPQASVSVRRFKASGYGKSSLRAGGGGGSQSEWSTPQPRPQSSEQQSGENAKAASAPPVRWPTLASPSQAPEPAVGLAPTAGGYAQSRYSAVMKPPSGSQQQVAANEQLLSWDNQNNNMAHQSQADSGQRHSQPLVHDGAGSSRRRSIEAQRRLTSSSEGLLYERDHLQQQPPLPSAWQVQADAYSPRADQATDLGGQLQSWAAAGANSSQQDLKHRSLQPTPQQQQQQQQQQNQLLMQNAASEDNLVAATNSPAQANGDQASGAHEQASFPSVGDLPSLSAQIGGEPAPIYSNQLEFRQQVANQEPQRHYYATNELGQQPGLGSDVQQQQQQQQALTGGPSNEQLSEQLLEQLNEQQTQSSAPTSGPSQADQRQLHELGLAQAYLARYQQQQRALAAQLARQQQQQQQRAHYASESAAQDNSVKRAAPAEPLGGYYPSGAGASPATRYHQIQSQQTPLSSSGYFQQLASSPESVRAAAQLAYQRLLYAQAARQAQLQQQQQSSQLSSGSQMYATSAVNSPVFYEAPKSAAPPSGELQSFGSTGSSRRSYLSSLFKPQASSRYFYGPQLLSPLSLASSSPLQAYYAPSLAPSVAAPSDSLSAQYYAAAAAAAAASNPYLAATTTGYASFPAPQSAAWSG